MHIKSNIDYWNELDQDGKVFSCLKDGLPHGFWENVLGYAYPIIVVGMIAIGIYAMIRFKPSERRWKTYLFSISLGTILGGAWCFAMQKFDPRFPGWLFAPWSVTGIEFGLTLEDWLFLPAATTLFYIVFRKLLKKSPHTACSAGFQHGTIILYALFSIGVFAATGIAGKSQIAIHLLPGLILFFLARKTIHAKHFIFFQIFTILFGAVWDLLAVSWVPSIPGLSWASQWSYITFDTNGGFYHSEIFFDYGIHRWAWFLRNPIEITPLMGICGGLLNYAMFIVGDKYFYKDALAVNRSII